MGGGAGYHQRLFPVRSLAAFAWWRGCGFVRGHGWPDLCGGSAAADGDSAPVLRISLPSGNLARLGVDAAARGGVDRQPASVSAFTGPRVAHRRNVARLWRIQAWAIAPTGAARDRPGCTSCRLTS